MSVHYAEAGSQTVQVSDGGISFWRRIELANAKSMRNMPSVGQVFRKERDAAAMEM